MAEAQVEVSPEEVAQRAGAELHDTPDGERVDEWEDMDADRKLQLINLQAETEAATLESYRDVGDGLEVTMLTDDMQVIREEFEYPTSPEGSDLEEFLGLIGVPGELLSEPELEGVRVPVRESLDRWVVDYDADDEGDVDESADNGVELPSMERVTDALLYPMRGEEARFVTFLVATALGTGVGVMAGWNVVIGLLLTGGALISSSLIKPEDTTPDLARLLITYGVFTLTVGVAGVVSSLFVGLL